MEELEARIVWSTNHYDGPAAGVAIHSGVHYWFHYLDSIDDRPRRFGLHPLSQSEFKIERQRHELFRNYVGHHCDYDESGRRLTNAVYHSPSNEALAECYAEQDKLRSNAQRMAYSRREPIGWFVR